MKRFFTKKSVALIFTTIVIVGFSPFDSTSAQTTTVNCTGYPFEERIVSNQPEGSQLYIAAAQKAVTNKIINIKCDAQKAGRDLTKLTQTEKDQIASLQNEANTFSSANTESKAKAAWGNSAFIKIAGKVVDGAADVLSGSSNFLLEAIPKILEYVFIPISAFLLAVAGYIMDFSIQYTIYGKGFIDMNGAIQSVWALIRDSLNICFIFILLYAAIQQIVRGTVAKQTLTAVIISAVLINFSLFTTKIIIDASNLVATSIYNQIGNDTNVASTVGTEAIKFLSSKSGSANSTVAEIDLSGRLMDSLGLVTAFDISNQNAAFSPDAIKGVGGVIVSFVRLILFLVTTYVFLFIAAVLAGRFVMLVLLMAISPVAFLFNIGVPRLEKYSAWWWGELTNQSLIGPAFTFLMLLTIKLAQALVKANNGASSMIIFFNFFLVIYLLLRSVNMLKDLSGDMGKMAESFASKGTGLALGAVAGIPAAFSRQTAGRVGSAIVESKYGKRLEALGAKGGLAGGLANMTLGGAKKASTATFDMRNTSAFKETNAQIEGLGGFKLTDADALKAGGKGGFAAGKAEKEKGVEEQAKAYSKSTIDSEKKTENEYKAKEASLQRKIAEEKDPKKKAELEKELEVVRKEREQNTGAGIEKEITDRVKTGTEAAQKTIDSKKNELEKAEHLDFGGADAKIKSAEQELKKKRKEAEDALFISERLGNTRDSKATRDQLKIDEQQIEGDIKTLQDGLDKQRKAETEKIKKEILELEKAKNEILENTKKEVEREIKEGAVGTSEAHKLILERRKMKENYADALRSNYKNRMLREADSLAAKAEGTNYDADKAKEDAFKKKLLNDLREASEAEKKT
jgi:hypothetical protein